MQNQYEDDEEEDFGPSKSEIKRRLDTLQHLGGEMTSFSDEQLRRIDLPEDVFEAIVDYRRMKSFGAKRRQLQLIGKRMRDMDPDAVREAIDRIKGDSRAAVALHHRCESLRDQMIADDRAVTKFIDDEPQADIPRVRTLVRAARKERDAGKPPKSSRELYRYLHELLEKPVDLYAADGEEEHGNAGA
jgi:ribosome-associated protein